ALLCSLRATVERTEDVLLPLTPGQHRRGLATSVVRFGGARVGVLSCHLSLRRDERYEQSGLLLDRLAALGVPHAVVGGDLNERPDGPAFRRIA
ncbi:endonuclease, partial [Streptomyces sp. TRM76130]|nr:endonuclease [Streptomyces sp. TRM76130]